MTRRAMALGATALVGGAALRGFGGGAPPATAAATFPVTHSDAEWQRLLTPAQYGILRRQGTEPAGSSPLDAEDRAGIYGCVGCRRDLFGSATKFHSGTGWPSFWAPLDHAVETASDDSFLMRRTEVHCATCGGHLGHVFDDGPQPTGLRYCMNGAVLSFRAA